MELLFWLGVMIVFLIIEAVTVGLYTIWFAAGALAAFLVAALGLGIPVEVAVFAVVSLALLIFTRPWALKYINPKKTRTNYEGAIGEKVCVLEDIDNLKNTGKVLYNGVEWTARAEDESKTYAKNQQVEVIRVAGVKLIVR